MPTSGAQGSARGARSGYGAMSLAQAPMAPWNWDNGGRAGLPVLRGIWERPKGMSWASMRGHPAKGDTEVPCVCLQGASVGQEGLGGSSMPAVHSWHSQPAAYFHRAGVGGDRDWRGALGVVPAPAPRFRAVCGGMLVCGSTAGAHWLHRRSCRYHWPFQVLCGSDA